MPFTVQYKFYTIYSVPVLTDCSKRRPMRPRGAWQLVAVVVVVVVAVVRVVVAEVGGPVVRVAQGEVRGREVAGGQRGDVHFAFEGIPYAEPPVGERRFMAPEVARGWKGVLEATMARPVCIQINLLTGAVEGEEDCLYLNVFTPVPPSSRSQKKLPVVVWLHNFLTNSSNLHWLRPDRLLQRGVVVVSIEYRVGVLGYLNSEDAEAPGNAGPKDAVMTLRWVQDNIAPFGGDARKVTVFGDGAGGTVVSYLLLSPLAKGLFHRALSMSGVALSPWGLARHPRQYALALADSFKGSCPSDTAPVACLRAVDAHTLTANAGHFLHGGHPYVPSVEAPGSSDAPFLATEPQNALRAGHFLNVPYMVGFTSAEGIIYLWISQLLSNSSGWANFDEQFEQVMPKLFPPGLRTPYAVRETRKFYLGNSSLRDASDNLQTINKFARMMTDLLLGTSSVSMARLMAHRGARVYMYEFAYEGKVEYLKDEVYGAAALSGVAHGDDVFYLFENALREDRSGEDASVRERWVQMFTDFAKWGSPTPSLFGVEEWKPYNTRDENYLHVDKHFAMKKHVLGDRIAFWRQLARCQIPDVCEENPVVYTQEGYVRGRRQQSVAGCSYFSWQGIRYAKPPVGPLRFKDAESPEPWTGVQDALQEGSICPQIGVSHLTNIGDLSKVPIAGDDDCLFVNVYSPQLPTWLLDSVPTMHWVHGGAFLIGSGHQNEMGPDYMICEGVLITTINYRLGPFGFLYLEEAAPGNAGLKDQVMSLRWVQRNIAAFLGMPQQVTIAGISAGGASVHLLLLSPLTKGLFQRAIAESGNGMDRWGIQTEPFETSRRLAAAVGCDKNDSFAIVDCLREVPISKLIPAGLGPALTPFDRQRLLPFTFVPTQDFPAADAEIFLPAPAIEIVRGAAQQPLPLLTGFTSRESFLDLALLNFRNKTIAAAIDSSWEEKIFTDLSLPETTNKSAAVEDLRQFYLKGRPLNNETLLQFMDMLTDIQFAKAVYYNLEIWAKANKAPLYEYFFDVDDQLNVLKRSINATDIPGAEHGSDGNYLFRVEDIPEVADNSSAALARRRMVRMWTNFVKFGEPTPVKDPLLQNIQWKPYKKNKKNYLYIGSNLQVQKNLNEDRENFWRKFYETYGPQE